MRMDITTLVFTILACSAGGAVIGIAIAGLIGALIGALTMGLIGLICIKKKL